MPVSLFPISLKNEKNLFSHIRWLGKVAAGSVPAGSVPAEFNIEDTQSLQLCTLPTLAVVGLSLY